MTYPDFFLIGAMKCGTSTLHDQLAGQEGVFMSTPKEPNFFSDDDVFARGADWYKGLFADAEGGDIKGESSTHYTKLPTHPKTIRRLTAEVGTNAKFIYVMRHPIDRLVSHYIHEWTQNVLSDSIDDAISSHKPLIDYGRYAYQLAPWIERFGKDRILPVFFERMTAEPQQELNRVAAFLTIPGPVEWREDIAQSNVSSERIRRFPLYSLLVENSFATALRRTIVPRGLRDKIKSGRQMRERPQLSHETTAQLSDIFNDDLRQLSKLLNKDLTCANFKDVARAAAINWR
ncbi:MAG: sulfotransferase [Pseudomonadota bacterium]